MGKKKEGKVHKYWKKNGQKKLKNSVKPKLTKADKNYNSLMFEQFP